MRGITKVDNIFIKSVTDSLYNDLRKQLMKCLYLVRRKKKGNSWGLLPGALRKLLSFFAKFRSLVVVQFQSSWSEVYG